MEPSLELVQPPDRRLEPSADLAVAVAAVEAGVLLAPAAVHRRTVLDFLSLHPDALHRRCAEGHLTGSAVVVDRSRGQALLMLHRRLGRWFQPGGHADGDANLAAVAWREATEETGIQGLILALPAIDVDVHRVEPPGERPHLHLDVRYLAVAPDGAAEVANHESLALRWVGVTGLDALGVDPSTRRLVERGLALADPTHGSFWRT